MSASPEVYKVFKNGGSKEVNDDVTIIDREWVNSRSMIPDSQLNKDIVAFRYLSTASTKFTNSSLGGNIAMNPPPQFTRYADIRSKKRKGNTTQVTTKPSDALNGTGYGMGRYYSEAIDDNNEVIFMEFGLPRFNSIIEFFTRAIDYEDSVMANTGRVPTFYKVARFTGSALVFAAFPIMSVVIWLTKSIAKALTGGHFKYYYMETNMTMYWGVVNSIATNMVTELGLVAPILMPEKSEGKLGIGAQLSKDDITEINTYMPGIISPETGYIDVYAIAARAQSNANHELLYNYEKNDEVKDTSYLNKFLDFTSKLNRDLSFEKLRKKVMAEKAAGQFSNKGDADIVAANNTATTKKQATDTADNAASDKDVKKKANEEQIRSDTAKQITEGDRKNEDGSYVDKREQKDKDWLEKAAVTADAVWRGGGAHVAFIVEYTGSASDSLSNSIGTIGTSNAIKSIGGAVRDVRFNLAGGNIAPGIGNVISAVTDIAAGVLDGVTFGLSNVVASFIQGGYIDIPKKWDDSEFSQSSQTYKIPLRSDSGDIISRIKNIYLPLSMILAGALPLATGNSSYTSPFLCSLFNKGVCNIKMGMIESVTIERGVGNLGFDSYRRPLAFDVTITVKDFSSIVAAPVSTSIFDGMFISTLRDDSPLGNYISVLTGRDFYTSKYAIPKGALAVARTLMGMEAAVSPNAWGFRTGEFMGRHFGGLVASTSLTSNFLNPNSKALH